MSWRLNLVRDPQARQVFNVLEVAEILGLGRSATYDAVKNGSIPSVRIGRKIMIPKEGLRRLLAGTWTQKNEWPIR